MSIVRFSLLQPDLRETVLVLPDDAAEGYQMSLFANGSTLYYFSVGGVAVGLLDLWIGKGPGKSGQNRFRRRYRDICCKSCHAEPPRAGHPETDARANAVIPVT